jgi:hypothetical protein
MPLYRTAERGFTRSTETMRHNPEVGINHTGRQCMGVTRRNSKVGAARRKKAQKENANRQCSELIELQGLSEDGKSIRGDP